MRAQALDHDNTAIALRVLAWIMSDGARAERLLALTGLDADGLRAGIGDKPLLSAIIGFVEGHEPDLIDCAEAIDTPPQIIVNAGRELAR